MRGRRAPALIHGSFQLMRSRQGTRLEKKFLLSTGWWLHGHLKLRGMSGCVRDVKVWSLAPAVWKFKCPWAWHRVSVWTGERKLEGLTVISFSLGAVMVKVPLCFFVLRCWDVCLIKRWNTACMPALSMLSWEWSVLNFDLWPLTPRACVTWPKTMRTEKETVTETFKHFGRTPGACLQFYGPAKSSSHICLADSLQ